MALAEDPCGRRLTVLQRCSSWRTAFFRRAQPLVRNFHQGKNLLQAHSLAHSQDRTWLTKVVPCIASECVIDGPAEGV